MIGQPAEEVGAGARMMLADGLFTRFPKPTHAIAFHDNAALAAGMIGIAPGNALANVDTVDVLVKGVGGHGAYPHTVKDPIVLASRIVLTLQTLVSRESNPIEPAVITVGSFHGGAKHNIVPDEVRLQITVRSYGDAVRDKLLGGIERIAKGEAIAAGMPDDKMPVVSVNRDEFTPMTFNTPEFAREMGTFLSGKFGASRVAVVPPVMGGEDFGMFQRTDPAIQSLLIWVGGVPQDRFDAAQTGGAPLPSLHSPYWAPDAEKVIATASEAMSEMAMKILAK
jgi:hippurate hydrolase